MLYFTLAGGNVLIFWDPNFLCLFYPFLLPEYLSKYLYSPNGLCSLISVFMDLETVINVMQIVNLFFLQSFSFSLYTGSQNQESLVLKIKLEWQKQIHEVKDSAFGMHLYLSIFLLSHYIVP